jgi:hypothetical protein
MGELKLAAGVVVKASHYKLIAGTYEIVCCPYVLGWWRVRKPGVVFG